VSEIASKQQLRMAFMRWAIVTVPFILLLGFLSGRSVPTGAGSLWYQALAKPVLTPPDWVFPVAWTILYVLMGLALALIIHARGSKGRGLALTLFAGQLAGNLLWTPIFFGAHQVSTALIVLASVLVLALAATILFARIRVAAAVLMLPYLAWLAFAGYLTYSIDQLNPDAATLVPAASSSQIIG